MGRIKSGGRFSLRRARQFLLLCLLLLLPSSCGQETIQTFASESIDDIAPVVVNDYEYLNRLSDTELRQICTDRGFDIVSSNGTEEAVFVARQDLLESARRCLTLESEMAAVLAEHPELAAELDKEIERMRKQKELLEKEREEMLVQKALLERQLQDAGIDIGPSTTATRPESTVAKKPQSTGVPDTLEGVLKESFRELYERVMQDVRLVQKLLSPVTRQLDRIWQVVWKYAKPVLGEFYSKARGQYEELQARRQNQQRTLPANN